MNAPRGVSHAAPSDPQIQRELVHRAPISALDLNWLPIGLRILQV